MENSLKTKIFIGVMLLLSGIGLIFGPIVFKSEPPEQNNTSVRIPVLERIVVLVRYNQTECPNLAILNRNQTINISKVKNITEEVYYAEIGRYDTNDPNTTVRFSWLNRNNCTPEYMLTTNTDFLQYIMSLGVPFDNSTNSKPAEQNETLLIKEQQTL